MRRLLSAVATTAAAAALVVTAALTAPAAVAEDTPAFGAPDAIAADYYGALLRHTRWVETVWDPAAGAYQLTDFNFAVVLGNAVLLTHGDYDADLAGVSKDVLRAHTLATIKKFAADNRLVRSNGTWGKKLFWDSTFESYFLDAGRLMWNDLDAVTQANLKTIATGQAKYTADLNFAQDPLSGSWDARWPEGAYQGDTALEESGVYTQALSPGVAWAPDDPDAGRWTEQLNTWARNAAGQPTADRNNPAQVGGAPISSNVMRNISDTYLVENHGSFAPHYQSDIWRSGGRNSIQFILNGRPVPDVLLNQPNSAELWNSLLLDMSAQGEPFMPMVADREFLYGRDVIPLAFVGQVLRRPEAVTAEKHLAAGLAAYQAYAPVNRLAKFSGEAKYEPEARAEIAISYLLHEHAAGSAAGPVQPLTDAQAFAAAAGVRDYGASAGIVMQQTTKAWAAALSKPGYVKFPWVPGQDSWLFQISGGTPFLYPSTSAKVASRDVATYVRPRDGFDGTASVFQVGSGYAGQVTLPTGAAVYASTGAGADDGIVSVRNLNMGGAFGLNGSRTYTTAEGATTIAPVAKIPADPADAKAARVDELTFDAPTTARYVRMLGQQGNAKYGYSMYALHAYGPGDGSATPTDVAAGKPATASSEDAGTGYLAARVTDGNPSTRWAVSVAERTRPDSWLQVDLGAPTKLGSVRLAWESAAGARYLVQVSDDGQTWRTAAAYGNAPADVNVARLDTLDLTPPGQTAPAAVTARYVRMQGVRGNAQYGYSLYHFRAFSSNGTDLAASRPVTASSADTGLPASAVTDGSPTTRWAVSKADRLRGDSWIQVDLGAPTAVSQVQLGWESAAGEEYLVQTSMDGVTWQDVARHRETGNRVLESAGGWISVENKGGFVVRGSNAPITVARASDTQQVIRLADGGQGPRLIEMVPGATAATAAQAARPEPTTSSPATQAALVDGFLVVFNLSGAGVTTAVTIPHDGGAVPLYAGTQRVGATSSVLDVTLRPGSAVVLAPRVTAVTPGKGTAPAGLTAVVTDGRTIQVSSNGTVRSVQLRNLETGEVQGAGLPPTGKVQTVSYPSAHPYPVADLALGTETFPASVLPQGMTSPALAVDGDAGTAWVPGPGGRMVVDLGRSAAIGTVRLSWNGARVPAATVSVSDDGLTFTDVGSVAAGTRLGSVKPAVTARYVAVTTTWHAGDAGLSTLEVGPGA
ncbi:discoidin domain-containing protein [Dactylosporangium sp. NPDC000244]|uniref:discoidin domain-containing protein n=1 Tax=Dactylosporangium sp. NPDC000244 TaxID=3154365 RepID=UPI0033253E2C